MDPSRLLTLFTDDTKVAVRRVAPHEVENLGPLFPEEQPTRPWAEKRMREFRAGRHVAREVLSALGSLPTALVPDADGVPCFPEGISASVTHTGRERTLAIAAATRSLYSLGIDVEEKRPLEDALCRHVLTPGEDALFSALGPRSEIGLLAFSAKESYYKCVFPKLRRFLNFHEVILDIVPEGEFSGELRASSEIASSLGAPTTLVGRYVVDDEFVFTTFGWTSPSGR